MKIGVDARELEGKRTGVGRYLENLLSFWSKKEQEFVLFFKDEIPELPVLSSPNFKKVLLPFLRKEGWLWEQVALPYGIKRENIETFFSPSYSIPLRGKVKKIVVIHDLSYFRNPKWFSKKEGFRRRLFSRLSMEKAHKIITVSNFVKDEMERKFEFTKGKVEVIYHGVNSFFSFLGKKREKIILTVGAIFQRRNIPLLLEGFKLIKRDDWKLVIVGDNRTYPRVDIELIVKKMKMDDRVKIVGHINDEELLELYNISSIFVSLSEYEGFGLPVLEAMACGLPCILFNGHSYKELFSESAYFINELSPEDVRNGINELIMDERLREELSRKGLEHSKNFSLEKCAKKTLDKILE